VVILGVIGNLVCMKGLETFTKTLRPGGSYRLGPIAWPSDKPRDGQGRPIRDGLITRLPEWQGIVQNAMNP
jgi:hypothetical protein